MFLHICYFLTAVLILAVLEVNTVHSPLFNIYCTCIVRSPNEFQISLNNCMYHKVASSRLSRLVAHNGFFRLLMKGIFDAYVLWPLAKRIQNWIVNWSTTLDFMVLIKDWSKSIKVMKRERGIALEVNDQNWFICYVCKHSAEVTRCYTIEWMKKCFIVYHQRLLSRI